MTDPSSLLKSNPTPELERVLRSAALDVPSRMGKIDTKARALSVLRDQQVGTTTALSAFALGTTVTRLVGAITQAGKPVSPFKLALRGAFIGASAGLAALILIAAGRSFTSPDSTQESALAASPLSSPGATESPLALVEAQLQRGEAEAALTRLNALERLPLDPATRESAAQLRVRALNAIRQKSK